MKYKLLSTIKSPNDLKNLTSPELKELAQEIRAKIVEVVSSNGGHLASNLGTVELTLALHIVFDFKVDRLVWDVGHQAYTHKLLTGRKDDFDSVRKANGLSGFCRPSESEYDAFISGHSSISISAALGIAKANELNKSGNYVVAVIGDGALTGGEAFEGLNNAGGITKNFIVIVNDNGMSINKNQGTIAKYLDGVRSKKSYLKLKIRVIKVLNWFPILGRVLMWLARWLKNTLKSLIYKKNLFENLGFSYLGPIDGNDIEGVVYMLKKAKDHTKPVIVHVKTQKGKGYLRAEKKPELFHAVASGKQFNDFSSNFGEFISKYAEEDKRVCAITAAMRDAVGLTNFSELFPNRFFDVGIAEQHAITFAAGLAVSGFIPVVALYSTFLQRGFDQLLHDVACQGCHIVLAIDRAGLVGEDGETHQGLFDVAFLSEIPNTTIYAPSNYKEQDNCLRRAISGSGICAVRYHKGGENSLVEAFSDPGQDYTWIKSQNPDILLVTYGRLFESVISMPERFKKLGISISILKLLKIHPILPECLDIAAIYRTVIFIEEVIETGSIAQQFGAKLISRGCNLNYFIKTIGDRFVSHGKVAQQLALFGLDQKGIEKLIREVSLQVIKRRGQENFKNPEI